MQPTVVEGISMWSVWQPDRKLYFNSFFLPNAEGNLAIDPLPLSEDDAKEIEERGGLAWVAITNRDHERDAANLASRFGARVIASALDAPLLKGAVDRVVSDGDTIAGASVIALEGLKSPGEFALHFAEKRALVLGDALWGSPAGALRLMPDDKLGDPARAVRSLRGLAARRPEHVLVGDGACIFGGAWRALWACLEARRDVYVNHASAADVPWRTWNDTPAGYLGRAREIGDYIGAEKLGFRLTEIPPGEASCPLHWHACEEELFVVLRGEATLVTQRGEVPLRTGDYVLFPTRIEGAHKVVNRTGDTCEILMIANTNPDDVCYYPDSGKLLVESSDRMVRDHPQLDYWEGE